MLNNKKADDSLSRRSFEAHSWVGLVAAGFLYLLCFSGVVSVLGQELERWEQPGIDEFTSYTPEFIDSAYRQFLTEYPEESEHIHIVFPRESIPRIVVENDHQAFFVNHDGSIGAQENAPWTKMITELHTHLHLPATIGTLLTGLFSVLLLTLILSGVLAHKTIFKEAFRLRLGSKDLPQSIDLHNRLSVWGLPFHLMIALTSCYFGLVGILLVISANLFHDRDQRQLIEQVFGSEPQLQQQAEVVDIKTGLENLYKIAPDAKPIFMTIHEAGTEKQFMEFYLMKDQRLIYSENYRFNAAGEFIDHTNPDELSTGSQILLSTYRLHFGDFAGFSIKLLYLILGAALSYIVVSGVNIWLSKRRYRDAINTLWEGIVWGVPLSFAGSFLMSLMFGFSPHWVFWLCLSATCFTGLIWNKFTLKKTLSQQLQVITSLCCLASLISHAILYSNHFSRVDFWSMLALLGAVSLLSILSRGRSSQAAA